MRAALLLVAATLLACGGSQQASPVIVDTSPVLSLGATSTRFLVEVDAGASHGRATVLLDVAEVERGELSAWLRIAEVAGESPAAPSPLAGLEGVGFRWRMDAHGTILAAGGPAAPSRVGPGALRRALELWTLVSASVPNLPVAAVVEGDRWGAAQRTEVIGGGAERVVIVGGQWHLAKILAGLPAVVVLEGTLHIEVRDPTLPNEEIEKQARTIPARAVVYVNLERRAVDFVTVASDSFTWQARRL